MLNYFNCNVKFLLKISGVTGLLVASV